MLCSWTYKKPLTRKVKLTAHDFSQDALQYMRSYLANRQQGVWVNNNFSARENIIARVPVGSILEPLLFNIFINDLLLFVSNASLSNYVNDNILYGFGYNLEEIKISSSVTAKNKKYLRLLPTTG